ncbi:MAG: glucose-6-phosphate dehydrogenase [Rhizomicrobium sp.]
MPQEEPIRISSAAETDMAAAPHCPDPVEPCAMVIFGASGDLTKRLLVPALYNLCRTNCLPEKFVLIGVARGDLTTEAWRRDLHDFLGQSIGQVDEAVWSRLAQAMCFVRGDANDPALYDRLRDVLDEAARDRGTAGNAIFYLAVADKFFGPIVDRLGRAKLTEEGVDGKHYWRRVVVEKPFGHSYESARELDKRILRTLRENQVFRIDHFLGKDSVQSITAFRFANGLFEPIWNRDRIDHVQITVAETVGVETRGEFYEQTGALRDMVPNHVLALVSMVAMEPPVGFDEASIRSKKADVFAAMPPVDPKNVVRGQYGAGAVSGKPVKAYRDEPNVSPDSTVETYVAMKLEIDNWRWAGVPFYVRTGKHLSARNTEIAICFKPAPYTAFQHTPVESLRPNWLVLRIQPNEGISLQFEVKRRGPAVDLAPVKMDFRYDDWFAKEPNVGYETLIHDVILGDPTLFMRADMVEQAWRVVQPVLDAASANAPALYESGGDGPKAAGDLIGSGPHRVWRPVSSPAGKTR